MGSGYVRVVASETRGLRFKSSNQERNYKVRKRQKEI